METSHYTGKITKALVVKTNDPAHPRASLQLAADIKAYVDVLPAWRVNLVTDKGKAISQSVYLKNLDPGVPMDVIGGVSDNRYVKVAIAKVAPGSPGSEKGEFQVTLALDPEAPIGPIT